jgi:excinuclease ABC subunit B
MTVAIRETELRRAIQQQHNEANGIVPTTIVKQVRDLTDRVRSMVAEGDSDPVTGAEFTPEMLPKDELHRMIKELETEMKAAAKALEFEKAALLRDQVLELKRELALREPMGELMAR